MTDEDINRLIGSTPLEIFLAILRSLQMLETRMELLEAIINDPDRG